MKRQIIRFTGILPFIPLILLSCSDSKQKKSEPERTRVALSPVRHASLSQPFHSNGILVPDEEIKLSFKTGGIVAKLPVEEGSRVKKGDVIASLDMSEIKAVADQAALGYDKALRDFERASNLYRDSVATLEQKQNAATALDLAKSRLTAARFNLAHSEIKAPSDGIILKRLVRVNEIAAPGFPVIYFGSSDKFWKIKASFSDKEIVRINPDDSAVITFDAYPDVRFSARVEQTGEIANPMTGTYEVVLSLDKTEFRLASGFIAGVELYPSSGGTAMMIPVEAVLEADRKKGFVYTLNDDSSVSKREIRIMSVSGPDVVIEGLPDTIREVISGGAAYLRNGEKVNVIRQEDK